MRKVFFTYIETDPHENERLCSELTAHEKTTRHTPLFRKGPNIGLIGIKTLHRYTHAFVSELLKLLHDADLADEKTGSLCSKVATACDICAQIGKPIPKKMVSLTNLNEAFNESLQADFLVTYIQGVKYFFLNIICAGTNCGE